MVLGIQVGRPSRQRAADGARTGPGSTELTPLLSCRPITVSRGLPASALIITTELSPMNTPPNANGLSQLRRVAKSLKNGDSPPTVTVRQLLEWFGKQRRSWRVVVTVKGALRRTGLSTEPDFATAHIDDQLTFSLADDKGALPQPGDEQDPKGLRDAKTDTTNSSASEALIEDPVLRVRMLPAANRAPVTVNRDDPVEKALSLMTMHDYSQLPVTQNMRSVDGLISWRSVLLARTKGVESTLVGKCMERYEEVRAEDSLLTAFQKIVDHEAVLVRGAKNLITGIVTATDLSIMFREQTEPFLLLSEIENHLRLLINGHFSAKELKDAKDSGDEKREVHSVTDLTFGECTRLLEKPEHWQRLGVSLDRKTFVTQLSEVREIRNDVMHFHPDGLSADELQRLKNVRRLLQRVR